MSENTLKVFDAVAETIHELAEKGDGPATRADVMAALGLVLDLGIATRLDAIELQQDQINSEVVALKAAKDRVKHVLHDSIAVARIAQLRSELR